MRRKLHTSNLLLSGRDTHSSLFEEFARDMTNDVSVHKIPMTSPFASAALTF